MSKPVNDGFKVPTLRRSKDEEDRQLAAQLQPVLEPSSYPVPPPAPSLPSFDMMPPESAPSAPVPATPGYFGYPAGGAFPPNQYAAYPPHPNAYQGYMNGGFAVVPVFHNGAFYPMPAGYAAPMPPAYPPYPQPPQSVAQPVQYEQPQVAVEQPQYVVADTPPVEHYQPAQDQPVQPSVDTPDMEDEMERALQDALETDSEESGREIETRILTPEEIVAYGKAIQYARSHAAVPQTEEIGMPSAYNYSYGGQW